MKRIKNRTLEKLYVGFIATIMISIVAIAFITTLAF